MVYQVVREDGQVPFKYGYVPCRNIFLTRGEAELFKVAVAAYNLGVELIIKESKVNWQISEKRNGP
jgi:hypothetical protein